MTGLTKAQMAGAAIDDVFGDLSVPPEQIHDALETLREQIDELLKALDDNG